jgi:hypothetical protein
MSEVLASSPIVIKGPFETKQEHPIVAGLLQAVADDLMAIGNRLAYDVISDDLVRQHYRVHIRMIVDEVKAEIASGKMTALEAAKYCSQLRDKLFVEYRKYTSAQGVAVAETKKLSARGFDYYLNKYSAKEFNGRKFIELSLNQRAVVYLAVMDGAARDKADVTTDLERLKKRAKALLVFTGAVAVWEIIQAKDHVKEAARQGNIIAAGMIGGGLAGGAVSFVCGPAEPICATVTVAIGANLGGMAGAVISDEWDDAVQFFKSLVWN